MKVVPRFLLIGAGATVVMTGLLVAALCLWPLPASFYRPYSAVSSYEDGTPMRHYITPDGKWRVYTPLGDISPLVAQATVCYEDRYFYWHPGVNPLSIVRAAWQNITSGHIVSGGSTLSMQLARVLEPRPRTVWSKFRQVARALQLEMILDKKSLVERYLNQAPYGGNHEGVTAASWAYFRKPPSRLTTSEAAYLVSLPQSPSRRSPASGDGLAAREGRDRVIGRMQRCALIGDENAGSAMADAVPSRVYPQPFSAPHAADFATGMARSEIPGRAAVTTLDRAVQDRAERLAVSYRAKMRLLGAQNVSVVVIENATRKVRALVGNADFFDSDHQGQVAGFNAMRSPGSALKPFLFALAIQNGVITTGSLLEDAPVQVAGFRPVNFSGEWQGLVRADRALSHSLNIPFVHLLRRTGLSQFQKLLRDGGLRLRDDMDYGLSMITGAVEVTLVDLVNLYVTLAVGGEHRPCRLLADANAGLLEPQGKRLFSWAAAHLTRTVLSTRDRPDVPAVGAMTVQDGRVAWKTGTSWGFRDAWAIGFNAQYTVGVWAGNFSGRPAAGMTGAAAAAPLMFDTLRAITTDWRPFETPPSTAFSTVRVCSESGYRATARCPHTAGVVTVRDAGPSRECPFHKQFLVEKKTGMRACLWKIYGGDEVEMRQMAVYPPAVSEVLGGAGRPPPYAPGCSVKTGGDTLKILSPSDGASYVRLEGIKNTGHIPIQGFTSSRDGVISWFVNDHFIGETRSGEVRLVTLPAGQSQVVAVNSGGHREKTEVTVSEP